MNPVKEKIKAGVRIFFSPKEFWEKGFGNFFVYTQRILKLASDLKSRSETQKVVQRWRENERELEEREREWKVGASDRERDGAIENEREVESESERDREWEREIESEKER